MLSISWREELGTYAVAFVMAVSIVMLGVAS